MEGTTYMHLMEMFILASLVLYLVVLIISGINHASRIKSFTPKGLMQIETFLIVVALLAAVGFTIEGWGTFNNPHTGALLLVFFIFPLCLIVVIGEIIIFAFVRNKFNAIKALLVTLGVIFYLWFISSYGVYRA